MKKLAIILIILAISLPVFAAAAAEQAPAANTDYSSMSLDQLKSAISTVNKGKFTVATSPDFAPYEFYAIGEDGVPSLAGFDMSLAQYIADFLGLELEVIPMDFDGTIMEVQNKNVDAGMAGYSPAPERAEVMEFSSVYYTGGQSFVTTKANSRALKTPTRKRFRLLLRSVPSRWVLQTSSHPMQTSSPSPRSQTSSQSF